MNALTPVVATPGTASLPHVPVVDPATKILAAARLLLPRLERGERIDAVRLRAAMEDAFGASDATGAWDWKLAYEAGEIATVLFLRKYGRVLFRTALSPAARLALLSKIAGLLPTHTHTHTRRSEEAQVLQQFSTPLPLGLAALTAAAITPADRVLEPSAGTGLLAGLAETAGGTLTLNELATTRASLLATLFPAVSVTRFDAAQIQTDAGERIVGRRVSPAWAAAAVANEAGIALSAEAAHAALLDGRTVLDLADGLQLRRVRVMGAHRIELVGFTEPMLDRLRAHGLFGEIIAWRLRFFVPIDVDGVAVLDRLLATSPIARIAEREAA